MDRGKINRTSGAVTMTMSESRFRLSRISRKREISSRLGSTAASTAVCLQFIEGWGGKGGVAVNISHLKSGNLKSLEVCSDSDVTADICLARKSLLSAVIQTLN